MYKRQAYDSYDQTKYSIDSILFAIKSRHRKREIFVIGGKTLYDEAYKSCDKIYLTRIEGMHEADTTVDIEKYLENFTCIDRHKHVNPYPQPHCTFEIWERNDT